MFNFDTQFLFVCQNEWRTASQTSVLCPRSLGSVAKWWNTTFFYPVFYAFASVLQKHSCYSQVISTHSRCVPFLFHEYFRNSSIPSCLDFIDCDFDPILRCTKCLDSFLCYFFRCMLSINHVQYYVIPNKLDRIWQFRFPFLVTKRE